MTSVNFYTLKSDQASARLQFACRLTEKAQSMGHRVFIHAESPQQAKLLDDLLWQFKASSFVPHGLVTEDSSDHEDSAGQEDSVGQERVAIGTRIPASRTGMLINLTASPCAGLEQFSRINEILDADPETLMQGRDRYRFYQAQGYQPETHKI
jgi:DNA polymerase-3 subunit chi